MTERTYTDDLTLYVLVTRQCQLACPYCIEKTKVDTPDSLTVEQYIRKISRLLDTLPIATVMWVGGEPLLHPGLGTMVRALTRDGIKHILTTNGQLISKEIPKIPFDAMNVSVTAINVAGTHGCLLNTKGVLRAAELACDLPPITINIPIIRRTTDDIETLQQLLHTWERQGLFDRSVAKPRVRLKELVGQEKHHSHVCDDVREFVRCHYAPVWAVDIKERLDIHGGTIFYRNVAGFPVYFNAPPSIGLPGARDVHGRQYQIVLFNDGYTSYSWDRTDASSGYKD